MFMKINSRFNLSLLGILHRSILLLHLDILLVSLILLDGLLAGSARLLGDFGITGGSGLCLARAVGSGCLVAPAVANRHLTEALLGAFGVLQAQSSGDALLVRVGLLGHVVEDGLDEAKFTISEASGRVTVAGSGLLRRHGDLGRGC